MYSTCLFCSEDLGSNEAIEHFPVGRRLAFDAAKGRLWVVCRKCERWNLTPLEERWEAIEDATTIISSMSVKPRSFSLRIILLGLPLVVHGRTATRVPQKNGRNAAALLV